MKFEKFLKQVGMFGVVYKATDGTKFLRCGKNGNVLARIPDGFSPLYAGAVEPLGDLEQIIYDNADDLYDGELVAANLPKDGKASDIHRVFGYESSRRVTIDQAAFSLIERGDEVKILDTRADNLFEDLEDSDVIPEGSIRVLVVLTHGDVMGIIDGVDDE